MSEPSRPVPSSERDVSLLLRLAGPRPGAPPEAEARVRAAAHAAWRRSLGRHRRRRALLAAAGLAAAVAAALGRPEAPPRPPARLVPPLPVMVLVRATGDGVRQGHDPARLGVGAGVAVGTWVETASDGRAAWRMGGASLRQDHDTRLRVRSASEVWLERGGIYVDSGASGSIPIEVGTAQGRVRELGTQFEVRASGERVRIRVREGSVVLLRGAAGHEARAGHGLDTAGGPVVKQPVAVFGSEWSWVEEVAPEFPLEGQTVEAFLGWTARETGWTIRFSRAAEARGARRVLLHGSAAGLTPAQALETVLPTCNLSVRRDGGTLWVETMEAP